VNSLNKYDITRLLHNEVSLGGPLECLEEVVGSLSDLEVWMILSDVSLEKRGGGDLGLRARYEGIGDHTGEVII